MNLSKDHRKGSRGRAPLLGLTLSAWLACLAPISTAQTVSVVNGASFRTDQPVAAGSWVSAFGSFANVGETFAMTLPLPKSLGGVSITVDGVPAAINYVSSSHISFLIPYGVSPGLKAVVVNGPGGTVEGTVRIINAAPGIFKLGTNEPPPGAIVNEDNSSNAANRPAIRGQLIHIYATGHGALTQTVADGAAAPADPPATTQVAPQVFIGGVECTVEFSGLVPGFPGLWRINARIPNLSFLAGKLPVRVFMNGVDSNEVTIYVAQ
jgi:uncharacterized protein (TIGR03437 family)